MHLKYYHIICLTEKLLKALASSEIEGDYGKILLSFVSSLIENSKELDKSTSEGFSKNVGLFILNLTTSINSCQQLITTV